MATAQRITLANERILDGDYFGLRQQITAQEPAGSVSENAVFLFDSLGGGLTSDSYLRVASLAQVTLGNPAYRPTNPCDYVVFDLAHGISSGAGLTLRFSKAPGSSTPLPAAWVALADLQSGAPAPVVERAIAAVPTATILQVSVPFWTPQSRVWCEVLDSDGDVLSQQLVTVRRRTTAAGTYRADRFYRSFTAVADAVNAAALVQTELQVLVAALVKDGKAYMQGTNPETVVVVA